MWPDTWSEASGLESDVAVTADGRTYWTVRDPNDDTGANPYGMGATEQEAYTDFVMAWKFCTGIPPEQGEEG